MSADPGRTGGPPPAQPQLPRRPRPSRVAWWVLFVIGLFALNYWAGSRATQSAERVRIPYSPFFLQEVRASHVASITSKGTAIQGTFTRPERYNGSKATAKFKTEIPAFANT